MNRPALAALLALVLTLGACASGPTVYAPSSGPNSAGYSDTRIETDRWRVTFRGNSDLKGPGVEDLALRRAAELTLQEGYDWFRVVSRRTELAGGSRSAGTSVGIGGSSGSYGSHVGVGIGIDLSPDSRRYEAFLEILLGRGQKPDGIDAYQARQLLTRPIQSGQK